MTTKTSYQFDLNDASFGSLSDWGRKNADCFYKRNNDIEDLVSKMISEQLEKIEKRSSEGCEIHHSKPSSESACPSMMAMYLKSAKEKTPETPATQLQDAWSAVQKAKEAVGVAVNGGPLSMEAIEELQNAWLSIQEAISTLESCSPNKKIDLGIGNELQDAWVRIQSLKAVVEGKAEEKMNAAKSNAEFEDRSLFAYERKKLLDALSQQSSTQLLKDAIEKTALGQIEKESGSRRVLKALLKGSIR